MAVTAATMPTTQGQQNEQSQLPPKHDKVACHLLLTTGSCKPCDLQQGLDSEDQLQHEWTACQQSQSKGFCKECEVYKLHLIRQAKPDCWRGQYAIVDLCCALAAARNCALLSSPRLDLDLESYFLDKGYIIEGLLQRHSQYDLYLAVDVSPNLRSLPKLYELRAYTLVEIPSKTKMYRVRSLKRQQAKPNYLDSFEFEGKKWVFNYIIYNRPPHPLVDIDINIIPSRRADATMPAMLDKLDIRHWDHILQYMHRKTARQSSMLWCLLTMLRDPSHELSADRLVCYVRMICMNPDDQGHQSKVPLFKASCLGLVGGS